MDASFLRAIILKTAFKPEPLRRAQAALLYVALTGETFTADILPMELTGEDNTLAGCAVGALASMKLLERVGRCKSPSKSRHGAWVNQWTLATGKRATAQRWLQVQGFAQAEDFTHKQEEMAL